MLQRLPFSFSKARLLSQAFQQTSCANNLYIQSNQFGGFRGFSTLIQDRYRMLSSQNVVKKINSKDKFLITGACGQIGLELVQYMKQVYGPDKLILTDIVEDPKLGCVYEKLDIKDWDTYERLVVQHKVSVIVHLASILSATGERNPRLALQTNLPGNINSLDLAKQYNCKIFIASTIATFGPESPRQFIPNLTIQRPKTVYGITKVFMELLGEYYNNKFGVDFRALRIPTVISSDSRPGGATCAFSTEIFYGALEQGKYTCYLKPDARTCYIYLKDLVEAIVAVIETPNQNLTSRVYNLEGLNFTPAELADEIKKHLPNFKVDYEIDPVRQRTVEGWPIKLDDSQTQRDLKWKANYPLDKLVEEMIGKISKKLNIKK